MRLSEPLRRHVVDKMIRNDIWNDALICDQSVRFAKKCLKSGIGPRRQRGGWRVWYNRLWEPCHFSPSVVHPSAQPFCWEFSGNLRPNLQFKNFVSFVTLLSWFPLQSVLSVFSNADKSSLQRLSGRCVSQAFHVIFDLFYFQGKDFSVLCHVDVFLTNICCPFSTGPMLWFSDTLVIFPETYGANSARDQYYSKATHWSFGERHLGPTQPGIDVKVQSLIDVPKETPGANSARDWYHGTVTHWCFPDRHLGPLSEGQMSWSCDSLMFAREIWWAQALPNKLLGKYVTRFN